MGFPSLVNWFYEMIYLKDDPALQSCALRPDRKRTGDLPCIEAYNRFGGLIGRLALVTGMSPAAALAVWSVESAFAPFRRGRPLLRFECHIFFQRWGHDNPAAFDDHFQFAGRCGIEGRRWEQHRFRQHGADPWQRFHGDQTLEYRAFDSAARLAGREIACQSASHGGPQIIGFNHAVIGYGNATAMWRAFGRSERWQICGFFDFCRTKELIPLIGEQRWHEVATVYNGPGNAAAYAEKLVMAFAAISEAIE